MNDDWSDLVRKAVFCQGLGNMQQALPLWQRAAKIAPLDHAGRFNYLLCRRKLDPQQDYLRESLVLAKESNAVRYSDHCVVIAILCCHASGKLGSAIRLAVMLAKDVQEAERGGANVWDLAGEASLVSEDGSASESKSGANIIRCLEALIGAVPRGSREETVLEELLGRYRAREMAMTTTTLPLCPPDKVWWKFW